MRNPLIKNSLLYEKLHMVSNPAEADIVFAIDVANYVFRQFVGKDSLNSPEDIITSINDKVLNTIVDLSEKVNDLIIRKKRTGCLLFCENNPAKHRLKLAESYKRHMGRYYYENLEIEPMDYLKEIFALLPGSFASHENYEGDDIISKAVKDLYNDTELIYILSTDRDLWPLSTKAKIITFKNKKLNTEDIQNRFNVSHTKWVNLVRSIFGDRSDNIPKVEMPRFSENVIYNLITNSDGTIENFYSILSQKNNDNEGALGKQIYQSLTNQKKKITCSFNLLTLSNPKKIKYSQNSPNIKKLKKLLSHEYKIENIEKNLNYFFGKYD